MLKSFFIPSKDNKFLPKIIGFHALFLYAIISFMIFLFLSSFFQVRINEILANLTQELIVKEVNPIREESGLLKLEINEKLTRAAQLKAEDMIKKGYFSHTGPGGERPWFWLNKVGYEYAAAGENLAIDCSDPRVLINAWLESPLHRKNILNNYFSDIGIGVAKGTFNEKETIITVMFLGREMTQDIVLAAGVKEDYKDNIGEIESSSVLSLDLTEEIPAEKPVSVAIVEDDILLEQNVIIAGRQESNPEIFEKIELRPTETKLFLINEFPSQFRLGLSVFLSVVILWILMTFFIERKKFLLRVLNSLIVLAFLFFIWL